MKKILLLSATLLMGTICATTEHNLLNCLRVMHSKSVTDQKRIRELEELVQALDKVDPEKGFLEFVKQLKERSAHAVLKFAELEAKITELMKVEDKDLLSTKERVSKIESYIRELEQEAGNVLKVL